MLYFRKCFFFYVNVRLIFISCEIEMLGKKKN